MPSIYWECTKSWYSGMGFCSLLQLFHSMHEFHMSAKILEKRLLGGKKKKWFLSTIHRIAASLWMVLFMSVFLLVCSPQVAWGVWGQGAGSAQHPPPLCALPSGGPWLLTSPSSWKETATGCGCFCICRLSVSPEHCKGFLLNIIVLFWSVFLKLNI